jgi:diadenylate cyclase
MPNLLQNLLDTFHRLDARSVLDILLIAGAIYWLLLWLRGTSAMSLLRGVAIVAAAGAALGGLFNLTVVNWLLRNSLTALLVAIPIIFQPEIRRALERVGRTGMHSWRGRTPAAGVNQIIATAARELAAIRHGALIVLEAETGLEDYVATGVRLDAALSVPLLLSIFYVNSSMHDGAVIIREGRVAAASCTLPLGEHAGEGHLGTRHRAGIGISERTDALAVVVSEETGEISLASNGRLLRPLDAGRLAALLDSLGDASIRTPDFAPIPIDRSVTREDAPGDAAVIRL